MNRRTVPESAEALRANGINPGGTAMSPTATPHRSHHRRIGPLRPVAGVRDCATPGCSCVAEAGRRFCSACLPRLERVRDELRAHDALRSKSALGKSDKGAHLRGAKTPICCNSGCDEPREKGRAYCPTCSAAGFTEEDS